MLLEGHGRQLYDAELQRQYQARYAGRIGTLYIHPPFETIVYLTVAWLPLKQAYLLWCLLNFGFLALAAWTAGREGFLPFDWRLLLLASLTFVPVLLCFMQGQDSLLLLLLETLAFAALRRKRAWAAGCWLGFGLFKFQLVLPMAMVFAMRRSRSRFLQGFVLVALALAGLCAVVSGWSVFAAYPSFLLTLQGQRFAGVVPQAMANFRGLTVLILGNRSPFTVSVIALLSVAALLATVFAWPETGPVSD
ncbi:MAG: glycosyltransferase family 87 protein, partial [Candidatus Sulfotelmatobacter sp.]